MRYTALRVYRLRQILLSSATLISGICFLAITTLWIRSYWREDLWQYQPFVAPSPHSTCPSVALVSAHGGLMLAQLETSSQFKVFNDGWRHTLHLDPHYPHFDDYFSTTPNTAKYFTHHGALGFEYASAEFDISGRLTATTWIAPTPLLSLLTALLPTLRFIAWRRRKSKTPGLCSACGYDLRATPDLCPECGTIPAKATSRT